MSIDFKVKFYNYERLDQSVLEISKELSDYGLISNTYQAYRRMNSRAFRSDLWRWMILWHEGGVFTDIKIELTSDLDWINFNKDQLVLCNEHGAY